VILFEKRGSGLSDPVLNVPTIEDRMDDIRAVMDPVGSDRVRERAGGENLALGERLAKLLVSSPRSE
jgi:hypothetical protein